MRAVLAHTTSGQVRGQVDGNGIAVFRGIPYARPPVGERRFLAPAPPDPWLGTRDAFEQGPGCWQVPQPDLAGRPVDGRRLSVSQCLDTGGGHRRRPTP